MDRVTTADTEDLTVVFIDLVRFTSLTEDHGDVAPGTLGPGGLAR